jgi:cytoskeletal protein CcmA (bactofilin family)
VIVAGGLSIGENLQVSGDILTEGQLDVEGNSHFSGDLVVDGQFTASDETNFTKNVVIEGDLTVNGTINGMESAPQDEQPQGEPQEQPQGGDLTVDGQLFVKSQANFEQDIIGNGQLTIAGQANLNGDAIINGQLFANQQANFNENVILSKDLIGPKAQLNEALIGNTSDGLGTTIKEGYIQSITKSNAALIGINQNVVNGNGGIKGILRESIGDTVAWLGYKDSSGGIYGLYTQGVTKTGSLISDREIYTNTIASTTGKVNVQGGMTANDFGKFAFYTKTINNGQGTAAAQKCLNSEILIACGGYSNQAGNYQGDVMYNNECTAMRSNNSGTLTVYAYCFDPRNLPY